MNTPEIEYLISRAIEKRPKATNAAMNLYIYDSELVCGARIVMPPDAVFVAHVSPEQLREGFGEQEWKLIVEKTRQIIGTEELAASAVRRLKTVKQNQLQRRVRANQPSFEEHRREQRLRYPRAIEFAGESIEGFSEGQMVDVSSGGMAFTCRAGKGCPRPGQKLTTRFFVPRFNSDGSFDALDFTRLGRTCRVDDVNKYLRRIAVQFAEPLPFKPAEQTANNGIHAENSERSPRIGARAELAVNQ
jgi:hypothetical protein